MKKKKKKIYSIYDDNDDTNLIEKDLDFSLNGKYDIKYD